MQSIDKQRIFPGHGPVDANGESLIQTADYLQWLEGTLSEAVNAGLTMNEAMSLRIPDVYQTLNVVQTEYERSVVHLYAGLEEALLPEVKVSR